MRPVLAILSGVIVALGCLRCGTRTEHREMADSAKVNSNQKISVKPYGALADGTPVMEYTLVNRQGMTMKVINYGGIVTSLTAPDRDGKLADVVLGYDSLSQYVSNNPFFGSLVGRYGNRIAKGRFTLDGKTFTLATNNNGNHLHGGLKGFDKVFWQIAEEPSSEGPAIRLTYTSQDMEEGYPGTLKVEVVYVLTDKNEWKITYRAATDKKTIVNLTQHSYFNLSGNTQTDILGHKLYLNAEQFIPVDKQLIPNGEIASVAGTPLDFRESTVIGARIDNNFEQLDRAGGYDHCWVLKKDGEGLSLAATLYDSTSGREMRVYTTEPGIQFYSGNFLDGSITGKYSTVYQRRHGLCLETEHFPDSPNHRNFPSVELSPGEVYETSTTYAFGAR